MSAFKIWIFSSFKLVRFILLFKVFAPHFHCSFQRRLDVWSIAKLLLRNSHVADQNRPVAYHFNFMFTFSAISIIIWILIGRWVLLDWGAEHLISWVQNWQFQINTLFPFHLINDSFGDKVFSTICAHRIWIVVGNDKYYKITHTHRHTILEGN